MSMQSSVRKDFEQFANDNPNIPKWKVYQLQLNVLETLEWDIAIASIFVEAINSGVELPDREYWEENYKESIDWIRSLN